MSAGHDEVARILQKARHILFVTGAGLSADSGLPTYRGIGGLYEARETDEGLPIEVALSGPTLKRQPQITWKYLWQIGKACRGALFNRGHAVMADIERVRPDTWVLTQNVDGLHRAAGSRNLIEIHGRAGDLYCVDCGLRTTADELLAGYSGTPSLPPRCSSCGGVMRPDVVLFGEMLPLRAVDTLRRVANGPLDLVFAVGTSAQFPYITEPVEMAAARGIPTVEINPATTPLSHLVDYRFAASAAETLDRLWKGD